MGQGGGDSGSTGGAGQPAWRKSFLNQTCGRTGNGAPREGTAPLPWGRDLEVGRVRSGKVKGCLIPRAGTGGGFGFAGGNPFMEKGLGWEKGWRLDTVWLERGEPVHQPGDG